MDVRGGAAVLLVDDDRSFLLSLAEGLQLMLPDVQVVTVSSAEGALRLLEQGGLDLVLTDIRMPGMDGIELMTEVRRVAPDTPVLVMTAVGGDELARRLGTLQPRALLHKPLDLDEVTRAITSSLADRRRGGRRGGGPGAAAVLPLLGNLLALLVRSVLLQSGTTG